MTDNNNTQRTNSTNDDTQKEQQPRLAWWAALTCFSILLIVDFSNVTAFEKERTHGQRWALAVFCITLVLGVLALVAHGVLGDRFVKTPLEGGLIMLCLGFWAAGLPVIMNPKNGIALMGDYTYSDDEGLTVTLTVGDNGILTPYGVWPNVYFFSWGSFAVSLILLGSFLKDVLQAFRPQYQLKRFLWWMALCTTSLVVMGSAGRTFHLSGCVHAETPEEKYGSSYQGGALDPTIACRRVKFAVALGVLSALWTFVVGVVSFVLTHFVVKHNNSMSNNKLILPLILESVAAVLMLVFWAFGMLFITISSRAPTRDTNNLYFGTAASFVISILLATDALVETYRTFLLRRHDNTTTTTTVATVKGETAPPAGAAAAGSSSGNVEVRDEHAVGMVKGETTPTTSEAAAAASSSNVEVTDETA